MPQGSAGLIGSINPSLPITPISTSGNISSNPGGSATLSGSWSQNILSPGASSSAAATGMIFWVIVGIVGFIVLFRS